MKLFNNYKEENLKLLERIERLETIITAKNEKIAKSKSEATTIHNKNREINLQKEEIKNLKKEVARKGRDAEKKLQYVNNFLVDTKIYKAELIEKDKELLHAQTTINEIQERLQKWVNHANQQKKKNSSLEEKLAEKTNLLDKKSEALKLLAHEVKELRVQNSKLKNARHEATRYRKRVQRAEEKLKAIKAVGG